MSQDYRFLFFQILVTLIIMSYSELALNDRNERD